MITNETYLRGFPAAVRHIAQHFTGIHPEDQGDVHGHIDYTPALVVDGLQKAYEAGVARGSKGISRLNRRIAWARNTDGQAMMQRLRDLMQP